jgi:hypothetical protein
VIDVDASDGSGVCLPVDTTHHEGAPCRLLTDCAASLFCYQGTCRLFCRTVNHTGGVCQDGRTCRDIDRGDMGASTSSDVLGVCVP